MVVYIPLSKSGKYKGMYEAIVDDVDSDLADFNWSVSITNDGNIYALRRPSVNGISINLKLHIVVYRRVNDIPQGLLIDHINGNSLDNRRDNLRIATRQQNASNSSRKTSRKYGIGMKGAYWNKTLKTWFSSITVNQKIIHLGYFKSEIDAHNAYKQAALIYFGDYCKID